MQYSAEKTYIDKTLAKDQEREILELLKKEFINKTDQAKLMNLLVSNELKLLNFGDYDRYLIGKLFVWLQDFALVQDSLFNYSDNVTKKKLELSSNAADILEKTLHKNSEVIKSLANLYLYLTRSGLSLGATGFDTITTQRFEYSYPQQGMQAENSDKGVLGIFKR